MRKVAVALGCLFLVSSLAVAQPAANPFDPVIVNGVSVPSDFPFMHVLVSNDPSPGYFFLNNWGGQPYNLIVDNTGAPIWYWRTPDRRRDFKKQPNGLLTMLVRYGYGGGSEAYIALDSTYSIVDTMRTALPYNTDEHELTMLEDGSYYMIGRTDSFVDMSQHVACGNQNAIVRETVVQGFTPDGELDFHWRSWDNFDIADVELENLCGGYIRFPHMNAIDIDDDGHVLVSSRHLSEVTKINRQTGEIIWRLSGRHNDFTFVNDPFNGFRNQHDIRALGNNRYTIFDNGNGHFPPETRVVEYELDLAAKTATLVWEYRHRPPRYTPWMGNAQRLPNGNTLVNYADASLPKIVEVRPDASKALEMDFVSRANTYRAFKFDWDGQAKVPYLVLEPHPTQLTLLFNKFGDSDVDYYIVYGGQTDTTLEELATTDRPFLHVSDFENGKRYYFVVTAVNGTGEESGPSNLESTVVNIVAPGDNMVHNGDFSASRSNWVFEVTPPAQAMFRASGGVLNLAITNGGTELWHVQVRQPGMPLINGRQYRFEFDAWADMPRLFEAKVTRDGDPWTNYGRIGLTALTTRSQHFTYDFVMNEPSDLAARVVLNAGTDDAHVYVDNVSLKELLPGVAIESETPVVASLLLHPAYPNPLRTETTLRYEIDRPGRVTLRLFDVLGRQIRTLMDEDAINGSGTVHMDARDLSAGTYFIQLQSNDGLEAFERLVVVD